MVKVCSRFAKHVPKPKPVKATDGKGRVFGFFSVEEIIA